MPPAYSWFLAVRYLLARWVNLLGIAGVSVAVWALIVVISVFSGFISEIRAHIRGSTADLVLTGIDENCSYDAVRSVLEDDPDVVATAPRLQHYGILYAYGSLSRPIARTSPNNTQSSNFVQLIGVDPDLEADATDFAEWLERIPPEAPQATGQKPLFQVPDLDQPFAIPERMHKFALSRADQDVPDGPMLNTGPGLLLSYRRMTHGEQILPGQLIDIVTARFLRSPGSKTRVSKIRRPFVVAGAYETRYRTFDETNAFVHIDVLREMLGQDPLDPDALDTITEVAIKTRPGADLEAVRGRLEQRVTPTSGGVVRTWEEQNSVFLGAVDHERAMMKLVLFAVMLVSAFLIYATLHMMVMQKIKDIGILTSLGATQSGIAAIFVVCGVAVATVGCGLGAVLGMLSAYYLNDVNDWCREHLQVELFPTRLYDLQAIPYLIEPGWVIQVLVAAFVLSVVVAYFPARRAARMDPVQALSYE